MNRKKIILIIEQYDNSTSGLRCILEKEGYSVISLYSSHYIQRLCCGRIPDLAVISVNMPKAFGISILRSLREVFPGIPIVAVSLYGNSLSKNELARLGADDFIGKPFDIDHFRNRIARLMIDN